MVALPQQVNTSDFPESGSLPLIPEGSYQAVILGSEMKPTKDNQGQYLQLKVVITQGQYANTEFTDRLNLINKNETAVRIAYQTLSRISEAVGMNVTPADSTELHNKPLIINVKTAKGNDYTDSQTGEIKKGNDYSEVKSYKPLPAGGAQTAPSPQVVSPAPQQAVAAPQNIGQQPVHNPFAVKSA